MTRHWFRPPSSSAPDDMEAYLEHLRPFGVRWNERWAAGGPTVVYFYDEGELIAEIGCITQGTKNGVIEALPYRGLGAAERMMLARCAQNAFETKPSARTGWRFHRCADGQHYWSTAVAVSVRENGELGRLVGAHQERMRWQRVDLTSPVDF